jgi:hypothetical protein
MVIESQAELEGRGMYDMTNMHVREAVPVQSIKTYMGNGGTAPLTPPRR